MRADRAEAALCLVVPDRLQPNMCDWVYLDSRDWPAGFMLHLSLTTLLTLIFMDTTLQDQGGGVGSMMKAKTLMIN